MKHLLLALLIVPLSVVIPHQIGYHQGYYVGQMNSLPSQAKIQEALGLEPDGVIGPESRRVWNEFIERRVCEEYAAPIMEKFMAEFDKTLDIDS